MMPPTGDLDDLTHLAGPAAELVVLRNGHTTVLLNRARRLLVRLYPAGTPVEGISQELTVCWYLDRHGLRVPQPAEIDAGQPILLGDGRWCTIWRLLDGRADAVPDYYRLGVRLRLLHAVPLPDESWPWSPVPRIAAWIEGIHAHDPSWLPAGAVPWLRRRMAAAEDRISRLEPDTDQVFCHGDPHPGNLLRTADGDLLVDYEYAGVGPREWDLSEIRCHARRFGLTAADRQAFLAGYGAGSFIASPRTAETLVEVRELMLTTWAIYRTLSARADPAEALLRLESLRMPGRRSRWSRR
ncbi:aminoglycoside phosphotransferase family protein [Micromonospora vinacea]|uniref:phosphotransferase family protein n=1 Tax=Micromonospora vinacea TaxID=709878 RepID=UPI003453EC35